VTPGGRGKYEKHFLIKCHVHGEIKCDDDAPLSVKIGLAVKWALATAPRQRINAHESAT
jgi:hypothetical protein